MRLPFVFQLRGHAPAAAASIPTRTARPCARLLLFLASATVALAQSVRWEPSTGTLPVGQAIQLQLLFENCAPSAIPRLPHVDGLTMEASSRSENVMSENGVVTRTVAINFTTLLTRKQGVEIPSFEVDTDKGRLRIAAARFDSGTATIGRTGRSLDSAASAKLTVVPTTVWAGEVFDLSTSVEAAGSYTPQFQRNFDWNADPLLAEGWSNPEQIDFNTGGEPHIGIAFRSRALVRTPGTIRVNSANHIVNLSVGVSGFGFFQQRQYDQYSITSNTPILEVKSLPAPPAGFSGAVGQFKLVAKVVPADAAVGEPITWTLELTGTGNWPDIAGLPSRDVSKDFNVVQPQARRTPAEGKLFDVTLSEDVVLVPTKPGSYTLGPISFVYFDPKSGGYKTAATPRTTVTITAPEIPKFGISPTSPGEAAETPASTKTAVGAAALSANPPPVPATPAGIPRDPLNGSVRALLPWAPQQFALMISLPFAGLLLCWSALALYRAHRTDPERPLREARARLAATIAELRTASTADRPGLLLQWQRDAAALWKISHAAPAPQVFGDADWAALWKDSDRALYGSDRTLAPDWIARAERSLAAKPIPGFSPARLFRAQNLFPFFAAAAVLLWIFPGSPLHAQDPVAAYHGGDFTSAEKTWRETVEQTPTDWIARYNLSLALAQLDRWNEAAAHATVAFVQHPEDPAVRWHFTLACEKAGYSPAPLAEFLRPTPARTLAMRASVAGWQRVIAGAAGGLALALALALLNSYGPRSRVLGFAAGALFTCGLAFAALGIFGIKTYGRAADTRAVITWRAGTLRSIPTEADTSQKTTPLAPGTVAVVDRIFPLGWVHLSFENGQTGWVRREDVVGFWK